MSDARHWTLFLAKRLAALALSLWIVSVITFTVTRLIGNPVYLLLGPRYNEEQFEAAVERLGLDLPLWRQYLDYLGSVMTGNLGVSRYTATPVLADLVQRAPATLELSTYALLLGVIWAVPAGIAAGRNPRGWFAKLADTVARAGVSIPGFWLSLLLVFVFFAKLRWLPAPLGRIDDAYRTLPVRTGWLTVDTLLAGNLPAFGSALAHLAMPVLALAVTTSPSILQITRARTAEVMGSDYIRSARAFGLSAGTIRGYAFRNMLAPVLTMITMTYGFLISGTVLVEVVFTWPGLGLYAVNAMDHSDYEPVLGVVLFTTAFYLLLYVLADIVNALVDPRARLSS